MESPQGGSERDKSNSSSSPISVVSNFWKEFDWEKERTTLDEQGLKIAENQENSQKNRRKLAENTRDFKKASTEEKLGLFNSLLKGYQEEVDNLTKRAKFSENAFLTIYQKLYEAPDPYPALASIADQDLKISELESENRKMKVELEEFRAEAAHLKNQQATIRRLEERNRQLELQMEEKVKEIVEIKQRSLAEENQKTLEVLKDREQSLQDQLRQAKESVSTMQKLHELAQSQWFELRAQSEEDRAAKQSEVNLLMDEVERAQTRLFSLEREKGLLRSQLRAANDENGNKSSDNLDSTTILENSLNAKERIISELNTELHNIESTLSNEREQHINDIKKLKALLNEKEAALEEMKKVLQLRPTEKLVDDLRKKVKILQAVGYNSIEAEDWEVATSGEEMSKLESLLLDKNRKMEHELTQLKVQLSEKVSLLETAEEKILELTTKIDEQQKLIQKLEDDILKGYSSKERKGILFDNWDLSEGGASEISENADHKHAQSDQDQSSMLKVICSQRDRFRTRLRETEEEIRLLKEKIGALTAELEKTKADNVKLYGKIRYVQDYNNEKVISRGSRKQAEDLESGFSSDFESKYKKIYEDDINPFAAFSKKERDQRYKELGIRDKITLRSGRFLLGNKYARTFAFFYTIGLHILVFTCLYRMSALSHLSNGPEELLVDPKNMNLPHAKLLILTISMQKKKNPFFRVPRLQLEVFTFEIMMD
ncbi:CASP, C-terminal [Dillenia turbinata]|uniref:Protein CASP n=1 Tax=Dillenia turbinata TaxID=194707 RepID=A0AAN8USX6_9MAGN